MSGARIRGEPGAGSGRRRIGERPGASPAGVSVPARGSTRPLLPCKFSRELPLSAPLSEGASLRAELLAKSPSGPGRPGRWSAVRPGRAAIWDLAGLGAPASSGPARPGPARGCKGRWTRGRGLGRPWPGPGRRRGAGDASLRAHGAASGRPLAPS